MNVRRYKKVVRVNEECLNEAKAKKSSTPIDLSAFDGPKYYLNPNKFLDVESPEGDKYRVYEIKYKEKQDIDILRPGYMEARMVDTYVYDEDNDRIVTIRRKRPILSQDDDSIIASGSIVAGNCNIGVCKESKDLKNKNRTNFNEYNNRGPEIRSSNIYGSTKGSKDGAIIIHGGALVSISNICTSRGSKGVYINDARLEKEVFVFATSEITDVNNNKKDSYAQKSVTLIDGVQIILKYVRILSGAQIKQIYKGDGNYSEQCEKYQFDKSKIDEKIIEVNETRGQQGITLTAVEVTGNVSIVSFPGCLIVVNGQDSPMTNFIRGHVDNPVIITGVVTITGSTIIESLYDDITIKNGNVSIGGDSRVNGGIICGNTSIRGHSCIMCDKTSILCGSFESECVVEGHVNIDYGHISGNAHIKGDITGNENELTMKTFYPTWTVSRAVPSVTGDARVYGTPVIIGNVGIKDKSVVCDTAYLDCSFAQNVIMLRGKAKICGNTAIVGTAELFGDVIVKDCDFNYNHTIYCDGNAAFPGGWDPLPWHIYIGGYGTKSKVYMDKVNVMIDPSELTPGTHNKLLRKEWFINPNPYGKAGWDFAAMTVMGDCTLKNLYINPAVHKDIYKDIDKDIPKVYNRTADMWELLRFADVHLDGGTIYTQTEINELVSGKRILRTLDFDDF